MHNMVFGTSQEQEKNLELGSFKSNKPDGSLNKFKAHFCICEDIQKKTESLADTDHCTPFISWSTICLMLALAQQLKLLTIHLDFSNAFEKANLPEGAEACAQLP